MTKAGDTRKDLIGGLGPDGRASALGRACPTLRIGQVQGVRVNGAKVSDAPGRLTSGGGSLLLPDFVADLM
jgi:hypothetical protein